MDMASKDGMRQYVNQVAKTNKWIVNKDKQTVDDLIDGLVDNKKRLGYQSCPCRLACGKRELDRDLICPCDYAQKDVPEFGTCYCNLYIRSNYYETVNKPYIKVPERRPLAKEKAALEFINESIK